MRTAVLVGGPDCGRALLLQPGATPDITRFREGDTYFYAATNGTRVYFVHPDCLGLADLLELMYEDSPKTYQPPGAHFEDGA